MKANLLSFFRKPYWMDRCTGWGLESVLQLEEDPLEEGYFFGYAPQLLRGIPEFLRLGDDYLSKVDGR